MSATSREELIDEIGADLLNYLKDAKLEIISFIKEINPNIKDLTMLMNIHFVLTDRVKYFIYNLPDNLISVGSIPHTWLFEKVSVVCHHGGSGTTAAGFRAGVPSVIIPIFK